MNYTPLVKPNQMLIGTGAAVIVTGWTPKAAIAKKLTPDQYAAIGNLYSPTRGISPLIRNLLANKQVNQIIALAATKEDCNAGSVRALLDFFRFGVTEGQTPTGRDVWVIRSPIPAYIDKEVPLTALNALRENVYCLDVPTVADAVEWACKVSTDAHPWGEPETFPIVEPPATVRPGARYGHRIEGATVAETWVKLLHRIKSTGTIRPTGYDGQWQELINLVAVVTDEPLNNYLPPWLPLTHDFLDEYYPQIIEDAPYVEGVKYTYGQRLRSWFGVDQVEQVVTKLAGEIDAASAVMNLWDVNDHTAGGSPCLNHIWVRVVDGELSLTATFRSNDMFSAWPANAMGLRALQRRIVGRLAEKGVRVTLGPLMTVSQSAHIYDDCWETVDSLIAEQYPQFCRPTYSDPVGNFVIEDGGLLKVSQISPEGEPVAEYTGKNPLKLAREIVNANPGIDPAHAAYLGIELQRAATQPYYEQDKP
jgi:thymidylate synthase